MLLLLLLLLLLLFFFLFTFPSGENNSLLFPFPPHLPSSFSPSITLYFSVMPPTPSSFLFLSSLQNAFLLSSNFFPLYPLFPKHFLFHIISFFSPSSFSPSLFSSILSFFSSILSPPSFPSLPPSLFSYTTTSSPNLFLFTTLHPSLPPFLILLSLPPPSKCDLPPGRPSICNLSRMIILCRPEQIEVGT